MGLFRLLVTGAAVAAGVHYVTKKRPDGTSIMDDLKAKAPEWKEKAKPYMDKAKPYMDKVEPYINQVKDQITKMTEPEKPKTNGFSSNPDPASGIGTL
ncbi:YtxH domain-containing protein [Desertivirga arenae]|uniref:YtxH domain-containing protein n=1 Tax=Desertivirga arenae TaxID=2810309 RepID=UPI001A95F0FA|nr:YtxH domain-containing protein [Pedobacter sp. SYSU D00823]